MTSPAITIGPDTKFPEIVDIMLANDVSGLPVLDDDGELLGIVTEADLVSKEAYGFRRRRPLALIFDFLRERDPQWVRKAAGRTAKELMTGMPATASPDDDLGSAARRMIELHHKRLPVVSGGRVVGVVSRHDLLAPMRRSDLDILNDVEALLADPREVPATHQAKAFVNSGVVTLVGDVMFQIDADLIGSVVAGVPGVVAVDNRCRGSEPSWRAPSL